MSFIAGYLLGLSDSGGGGGPVNLHEIFLNQPTALEAPLVGEYRQVFKLMPDNCGQIASYQYSDYTNDTPEGHLFALWQIAHTKPYTIGTFRGDEYLGINLIMGMNTGCYTIYQPNSDYTQVYLSQDDVLKNIYDYKLGENITYNYQSMQIGYQTAKADIERTKYTESGNMTKEDITVTLNLSALGVFNCTYFPYVGYDRMTECANEYARLCNAKYHELN